MVSADVKPSVSYARANLQKWLHPASLPMKTIVWCCFAAGVGVAMLVSEETARKREERFGAEVALKYRPC